LSTTPFSRVRTAPPRTRPCPKRRPDASIRRERPPNWEGKSSRWRRSRECLEKRCRFFLFPLPSSWRFSALCRVSVPFLLPSSPSVFHMHREASAKDFSSIFVLPSCRSSLHRLWSGGYGPAYGA